MTSKYYDHLQAFKYKYRGREYTVEAKAMHNETQGEPRWSIAIDGTWMDGFAASHDDKEEEVQREVEWKVQEYVDRQ